MVAQPLGPIYNNLIVFDPTTIPRSSATWPNPGRSRTITSTYTFTLHEGVKFHDGSELTSADVKASWDRMVFPPEGVVSPRRSNYPMIKSIEAPEPLTVVFHLHHPSPSFLTSLAHPANFIYAKKYLDGDLHYYKNNAVGTGPFKLKKYVHGSVIELERNPNYWKKGFPYLDGIKYFIITDDGARAKAIRAGRVDVELRFLPPGEVEAIKAQMGDKVVVAGSQVHRQFWRHLQCGQEALRR